MNRFIEEKLTRWKDKSNRKPLILRGARQVGKTYTITAFGKREFSRFVLLDFEQNRSLHKIFSGDLDIKKILIAIEAHTNQRIIPGETLLFFDEIQACSRALMSLRYFYEQLPKLHLIAAGSLLELALEPTPFPVGRVEFEWMYPMSFSEFLDNMGMEIVREQIPDLGGSSPINDAIHEKLMEQLRTYFLVGGMPEAVRAFQETSSVREAAGVHRSLLTSILQDISKYNRTIDVEYLETILERIPSMVGKQTIYQKLHPGVRVEKIKKALGILIRSLMIHKIPSSSAQGLPLGTQVSDKVFKYLFLDIGLMQTICGIKAGEVLHERNLLSIYQGALAEQFVGQEMLASGHGSENGKLYYWARSKRGSVAEVDYVMARDGNVLPVEVKSGPSGKLRSLHLFLKEHPGSPMGIVLSSSNIQELPEDRIKFMPLYTNI